MKLTPWEPDLRSLIERIEAGDIDLQPDFQRQEVWSLAKKKRLIDTILRGWSIPPVHLVATTDNRLEVLDGQQRLASIRDFFANRISIDGTITPEDSGIKELNKKTYAKLDPAVRRRVDQYALRCFRISDYHPEEPSELFYRLNQPTMLTAGEQRNALYGPARVQLKELVNYFISLGNDTSSIGFSNTRLAYDDIIARLLFFLEIKSFAIKGTETRISERFRSQSEFDPTVFRRALRSIEIFSESFRSAPHFRLNKASLISWLLFFSRFTDFEPNSSVVPAFFDAKHGHFSHRYVSDAVALFEDRASLRVTDVSSVVLRDLCLWYLYKHALQDQLPRQIDGGVLDEIYDTLSQRDDVNFEYAASEAVSQDSWGASL